MTFFSQTAQLEPIAVPFGFDGRGRTAETTTSQHLQDLIENVLFTTPGERVMRPTFGSGLLQLAFTPNSDQLAATLQVLVQGALSTALGGLIQVGGVAIEQDDGSITVSVSYTVLGSGEATVATFAQIS